MGKITGCEQGFTGCFEIPRRPAPFAMSYMVGRKDKRTNNRTIFPPQKNNAAAGYKGPVKIELLKGEGLLKFLTNVLI